MPPPRPHPLTRSPLVDRINKSLGEAWRKGWLARPPLGPEALFAKGSKGFAAEDEFGGRSEADSADFRERLSKLSEAVLAEAELNPLGQAMAHGQLVRVIRQRFGLGKIWREKPEVLEIKLKPPIIVIGQMRAGTTRIHRLLAADPAFSATRFCDSWHPVPTRIDTRPMWSSMALFMARRIDPWIDALHPFGATRIDEELGWLASALDHSTYEAQWHIPSYVAFGEQRDPAAIYREFARILHTDAAHHGNGSKPRVMKAPQFSEDLGTLLDQFPDARIVVARRKDDEVVRSAASLVANQMAIQSDNADMDWIEAEWERKIALRHQRTNDALANFDGPVAEIDFEQLGRDWKSAIKEIYGALGLECTPSALSAMRAEQKRAAGGAHHAHRGQLKKFEKA